MLRLANERDNMSIHENLSSSMEDYLETILELSVKNGRARVRDIALELGVGKPAVTAALKTLCSKGLLEYAPYKPIILTNEGEKIAAKVTKTHGILQSFLTEVLGLEETTAEANACRMEHAVDAELISRIVKFVDYIDNASASRKKWMQEFRDQFVNQNEQ